jgi:DNA-binding protein HU-beta
VKRIPITFFPTLPIERENTMNRMQMINTLAATGDVTKKVAERQLTALLGAIRDSLSDGEEVVVNDNFKLSVDTRAARTGRNPKTGEALSIPAKRVIKFTAYKHFRDAVGGA